MGLKWHPYRNVYDQQHLQATLSDSLSLLAYLHTIFNHFSVTNIKKLKPSSLGINDPKHEVLQVFAYTTSCQDINPHEVS